MNNDSICCDRTSRGSAAAELDAAREAALCAFIVHEITQPVAAIIANASACLHWLAVSPSNHKRVETIVERILESALSASDIVGGIRALFTQHNCTRPLVPINDIIREACTSVLHEQRARKIEIAYHLDTALPTFALNRIQIRQLLVNLIHNGIEAMGASHDPFRLGMHSRRDEDGARVEVRDWATCTADAMQIFDNHFSSTENGMGIGIAICRQIVEAHGGRFWMEPAKPHGTRMIFTLPKPESGLNPARIAA